MTEKPVGPLRRRMFDDMTARRFNEHCGPSAQGPRLDENQPRTRVPMP